ncbi:uncharacterized protein BYT42DRAFT_549501 [Radiomyces spectabilis]|uniref:uncharacterized protein n=1 Tax=Radiomyces spectabilis TaxID=64574 RepID=UPI002220EB79|nr:uncharacterized protein BYT42DRAFT_549501 [Radiomyces spectabilis]KAI8368330.1 hypothetical protein BYT42DRAFT_549501 [Radiomyces spectabilis]
MSGQPPTVTTARLTPKKRRNEDTNSDAQKIERLEAKVRGLERKIVKLERESAERKQVAPVTTMDLDLNERVRKHYEYLGEQKQLFWDLEAGFNRSRNPDVAKALIGFIEQLPDEIRKPSWTPRVKRDERQAAFYVAGAVIPSHFPGAESYPSFHDAYTFHGLMTDNVRYFGISFIIRTYKLQLKSAS